MFIVHLADGETLTGKNLTWDEVPDGITGIELTLPFKAEIKTREGEIRQLPARTINLNGLYDEYYYSKEAVAKFGLDGASQLMVRDVAEIIGAINNETQLVTQIRVTVEGNIKINTFPLENLKIATTARRKVA